MNLRRNLFVSFTCLNTVSKVPDFLYINAEYLDILILIAFECCFDRYLSNTENCFQLLS